MSSNLECFPKLCLRITLFSVDGCLVFWFCSIYKCTNIRFASVFNLLLVLHLRQLFCTSRGGRGEKMWFFFLLFIKVKSLYRDYSARFFIFPILSRRETIYRRQMSLHLVFTHFRCFKKPQPTLCFTAGNLPISLAPTFFYWVIIDASAM